MHMTTSNVYTHTKLNVTYLNSCAIIIWNDHIYLLRFLFKISSIIILAKDVTRFGEVSYSFEVECDANKKYYSSTLKKKIGGAIIGSITLPFEVM